MRLRTGLVVLALCLLGAACTGEVVDGSSADGGTSPAASEDASEGGSEGASPGASPGGSADPHGELACDADTQAAIDATIDGQLAAFSEGDYAAALDFSSEAFRAGTSAEAFGEVIESDYPVLRDASGHTSSVCVAQGDEAQLLVAVEGTDGISDELLYRMTQEAGEWRIAVAARVPGPASEEPVPV